MRAQSMVATALDHARSSAKCSSLVFRCTPDQGSYCRDVIESMSVTCDFPAHE